jgi:hypothetical protein
MSDTLTLPAPPQRTCSLEEVFDANFIELLKLVPANPYVRALILKFSGKLPPAGCETFDQLKEWVEFNCVKRIKKSAAVQNAIAAGIAIDVDFSETEYGRADYSVERYGTDTFSVDAEDLVAIIHDAITDGGGIGDVVDVIAGKIDDDAWLQCNPDLDGYGDYDYSDHESTESSNAEVKYSRERIREAVLWFVRERHPELAAEL